MRISVRALSGINIFDFHRMERVVDLDPPYQREGGVWNDETRKYLIDSIINGFDIPKIYFEVVTRKRVNDEGINYRYAVLDGKQRLQAILSYMRGELTLPDDFIYFEKPDIDAKALNLEGLKQKFPEMAARFLEFELPLVTVETDSGDLVEEMFQRLNASAALNAAERRNAISGATRDAVNELAKHNLLVNRSPIRNARYKYRELAAKFLAIEQQLRSGQRIRDTKAKTLLQLFLASSTRQDKTYNLSESDVQGLAENVRANLDSMNSIFEDDDRLLASVGTFVVYYICTKDDSFRSAVTREALESFENYRRSAGRMNEDDADYSETEYVRLREYNALVQSTNDGTALSRRVEILSAFVVGNGTSQGLPSLRSLADSGADAYGKSGSEA